MPLRSDLDRSAARAWDAALAAMGWPSKGWRTTPLARRDDPETARIAWRARHPDGHDLAVKHQIRPWAPDRFAAAHAAAFAAFPHDGRATLARPVLLDAEHQIAAVDFLPGTPLSEAMREAPDRAARLDLLCRAGAWAGGFHRAGGLARAPFDAAAALRPLRRARRAIREGGGAAAPFLLHRLAALAERLAPLVEGRDAATAPLHGDLHMRNLLVLPDGRVAGIDLGPPRAGAAGEDLAKLLIDHHALLDAGHALPPGAVAAEDAIAALCRGHGGVDRDDPGLRLHLVARLARNLLRVPPAPRDRSDAHARTLARLRPMAARATAPLGAGDVAVPLILTRRSAALALTGRHPVVPALLAALDGTGLRLSPAREAPASDLSLVHMRAPLSPRGIVFRHAYGGPFWRFERTERRADWPVARARFDPERIDPDAAARFFRRWRDALHPGAGAATRDGPLYMPLQGRLLERRSFQHCAPIAMIRAVAATGASVRATLHPRESYAEAERAALAAVAAEHPNLVVAPWPMADALRRCAGVVTMTSSVAVHALLHDKPAALWGQTEFHHACLDGAALGAPEAVRRLADHRPDAARYLWWFWKETALDLSAPDIGARLRAHLGRRGWPVGRGEAAPAPYDP